MDIITYSLSKKIAASAVSGVKNMSVEGQTLKIVTNTNGTLTMTFPVPKDGLSVTDIDVNANNQIVFTMSDGSEFISGKIPTVKGDKGDPFKYSDFTPEQLESLKGSDGFSPSAKIEKVGDTATITITDKDGTTTATIKDGQGGTGSGEENKIDSISVNGVNVPADENKNVDITVPSIDGLAKTEDIPTKVSELTNDSGYLTAHQDISGKVDKVEGKSLISDTEIARLASVDNYDDTDIKAEIAKKADATAIPSKVSVLENDSKYQTESDVTTTLTDYATKTYVGEQITNAEHLKREIVTVLPSDTEASDNIIYMLKVESATGNDKYQEYMKIDGTVQMVGDTSVDLTDYAKSVDIPTTVAELTDSADYAKTADVNESISTLQTDKADASDLTAHTDDADIHVTTDDKTAWNKVTDKVDKIEGKGLSTNDYTNEDKALVDTIGDKVDNSDLSQLEFDKLSGGKNLWSIGDITVNGGDKKVIFNASFEENTQYTFSFTTKAFSNKDIGHFRMIYTDGTNTLISFAETVGSSKNATSSSGKTLDYIDWYGWSDGETASFEKIQLEKGTTATAYEPYISSVKMLAEEVSAQNESLSVIGKCKNLLNSKLEKTTENGITCTANGDGTYTLNGTAIDKAEFVLSTDNTLVKDVHYLALLANNFYAGLRMFIQKQLNPWTIYYTCDSGSIIDVVPTENLSEIRYVISINKDTILDNVIVKPMITTDLNVTFDDFVPYTGDGKTLTHDVAHLNKSLEVLGKCKNLLNPTLQTTTQNGVTCTNNGDGTYTLNGTASSDIVLELESYKPYTGNEIFRLVGCPSGGSASTYYLGFRPNNAEENRKDIGSGVTFNDLSTSNKYAVAIIVLNGTTVTNLTFKPMLTTNLSATYDDFVPYTGDGETLTHDVAELNSNLDTLEYSDIAGGKNLANINDFKVLTSNPSRYGYEWLSMKGGTYTFNITNGKHRLYIGYKHNGEFVNPSSVINGSKVQTITISDGDDIVIWYDEGVTEDTVTRLQLEEGSVATSYEPYIPSVKMLADKIYNNTKVDIVLYDKFDTKVDNIQNRLYLLGDILYGSLYIRFDEEHDPFTQGFDWVDIGDVPQIVGAPQLYNCISYAEILDDNDYAKGDVRIYEGKLGVRIRKQPTVSRANWYIFYNAVCMKVELA